MLQFICWGWRSSDIIVSSLMKPHRQKSPLAPTMAAGGIVVKAGRFPLIAVVQRRKDGGWVLPRGKQKPRDRALAAAQREVEKEICHTVVVQDFLGTISCKSRGRPKVIQFWLMVSVGQLEQESVDGDKAVKWLPLKAAVACLSEPLEQAFLANVGQQSLAETRVGSPHDKSRLGRNNFAGKLQSTRAFGKSRNGRKTATRSAKARAGNVPRKERSFPAKSPTPTPVAPNFVRRLLRRLKSPRLASDQGAGWLN